MTMALPPGYVMLLAGPHDQRAALVQALEEAGYYVSKRTDSGNLPTEDKAWIRTYGQDPSIPAAIASLYDFELRACQIPIRPLAPKGPDPVEEDLGRRLDALFDNQPSSEED